MSYALVALVAWGLYRTRAGLLLRASGERPEVVAVAGRRPDRVQMAAVVIGGALGGIGGAQLSVGYVDSWFDNMTNGYGFIAVAVVLFSAWRPLVVLLGCLGLRGCACGRVSAAGAQRRGQPVPARRAAVSGDAGRARRLRPQRPFADARGAGARAQQHELTRRLAAPHPLCPAAATPRVDFTCQ